MPSSPEATDARPNVDAPVSYRRIHSATNRWLDPRQTREHVDPRQSEAKQSDGDCTVPADRGERGGKGVALPILRTLSNRSQTACSNGDDSHFNARRTAAASGES